LRRVAESCGDAVSPFYLSISIYIYLKKKKKKKKKRESTPVCVFTRTG